MNRKSKGRTNDVKVIGIKPGKNCHKEYLKVLKAGQIYLLYNDYQIDQFTGAITHTASTPSKLYRQGNLSINISAIAGQNGSGKSSLIELLFMAINNIAVANELNDDLVAVEGVDVELYCLIGNYYKIVIHEQTITVYEYEMDTSKKEKKNSYTIKEEPLADYDLNGFFFTIAVNYSLYAYNSLEIIKGQKDWLKGLFHKNDSYQTPLVINLWRNQGNIDINNENALARLRLMANILRPVNADEFNFRKMTDNLIALKLRLTVNRDKSNHVLYTVPEVPVKGANPKGIKLSQLPDINKHEILKKINKLYPFNYKKPVNEREIHATDYLIGKLITIAMTYTEYKANKYYTHESGNFDMDRIDEFLENILDDPSHIVFKIKQTLNFLKFPYLAYESKDVDIKTLSENIDSIRKKTRRKYKIEELIPPPIFKVDILLAKDDLAENEDLIAFHTLSSGERQLVYSISSLIYHLINLDSVRRYKRKIKYDYINIVLEEVELYFHPEMQRCFIKKLLDSIKNIQLDTIKGINLCFVTHSPFILSDIPDSNVMFLKVVDKVSQLANREEKTFGANIHDLLADGFFMYNGLCGEFASQKINETINFLEYSKRERAFQDKYVTKVSDLNTVEAQAEKEREEKELKLLYEDFVEKDKKEHYKLIKSIGESVLSVKLLEMYDEVFKTSRRTLLQEQIDRLTLELQELDSTQN